MRKLMFGFLVAIIGLAPALAAAQGGGAGGGGGAGAGGGAGSGGSGGAAGSGGTSGTGGTGGAPSGSPGTSGPARHGDTGHVARHAGFDTERSLDRLDPVDSGRDVESLGEPADRRLVHDGARVRERGRHVVELDGPLPDEPVGSTPVAAR